MIIKCERRALLEALQTANHGISTRSTQLILSHIRLIADKTLSLYATDLEMSVETELKGEIKETGGIAVPARALIDVISHFTQEFVILSTDEKQVLRVRSGKSDYKILGLSCDNYPTFSAIKDEINFTISGTQLKDFIKHTLFAVSTDETRAILTGICIVKEKNKLTFVATDTHRLAIKQLDLPGDELKTAIIPSRALSELFKFLDTNEVEISLSETQIRFKLPELVLTARTIVGKYVDYTRVIPISAGIKISVSPIELIHALKRAIVISRNDFQKVVLKTDKNKLIIETENKTVGSAYEEIELSQEVPSIEATINAKYLIDVLNSVGYEDIILEFNNKFAETRNSLDPLVIKSEGGISLLMPITKTQFS